MIQRALEDARADGGGRARALAPFAQKSGDSRGRKFPEPRHAYRTEFQRDRARIIHSRAFRRLEYKTQVFLNGTGDHLRTRLTHTFEVASISRTIARALALNEDLAEAIALAHDLGHPPFGHSGEEMLAECMQGHGGFEHNRQSLRVVDLLEAVVSEFSGTESDLRGAGGIQKHQAFYDPPEPEGEKYRCPLTRSADRRIWRTRSPTTATIWMTRSTSQILNEDQLEESRDLAAEPRDGGMNAIRTCMNRSCTRLSSAISSMCRCAMSCGRARTRSRRRAVETTEQVRRQERAADSLQRRVVRRRIGSCGGFFTRMSIIIRGWRR